MPQLKRYDKLDAKKYPICECGHFFIDHGGDTETQLKCEKCKCSKWNPIDGLYTAKEIIIMREQAGIKS